MWCPPCLLLLVQALAPSLAGSLQRHPEHQQSQEDPVFLDDSMAHRFLGRKLLYNHWDFELIVPDNLERECKEEVCSYEEAREVFEDDILTAEDLVPKRFSETELVPWVERGSPVFWSGFLLVKKDFWEKYPHNGKGGARTSGVDVAGLVAGLIAALVSAVMIAVVAMYCFKYRAKQRRQSRTQDSLHPGVPLASFDDEPKPESAPGLPTYEQALEASGMHDAPPPPYNRNSTNMPPPT